MIIDEDESLECISQFGARWPPAARFAFETAALDLAAQARGIPLAIFLGGRPDAQRKLSALLPGRASPAWIDATERALRAGSLTVKAKIGAQGLWEQELVFLRKLRVEFGYDLRIRVDANRSMPQTEVPDRLAILAEVGIEVFEEPSAEWADMTAAPVALAADESLMDPGGVERVFGAIERGVCRAVVLKPALLGGLIAGLDIAVRAKSSGAGVIVTHLFDGPIGQAAASALALAVCEERHACGLQPPFEEEETFLLRVPSHPGLGVTP